MATTQPSSVDGNSEEPRKRKREREGYSGADENGGDVSNAKKTAEKRTGKKKKDSNKKKSTTAAAITAPSGLKLKTVVSKSSNKGIVGSRRRRSKDRKAVNNVMAGFMLEEEESAVWKLGKAGSDNGTSSNTVQRNSMSKRNGLPFEITVVKDSNIINDGQRKLANGMTTSSAVLPSDGMLEKEAPLDEQETLFSIPDISPLRQNSGATANGAKIGTVDEVASNSSSMPATTTATIPMSKSGKVSFEDVPKASSVTASSTKKRDTDIVTALSSTPKEEGISYQQQPSTQTNNEQQRQVQANEDVIVRNGDKDYTIDNDWIDRMTNQMKQKIESKLYDLTLYKDESDQRFKEQCRDNDRLRDELNTEKELIRDKDMKYAEMCKENERLRNDLELERKLNDTKDAEIESMKRTIEVLRNE